MPSPTYARAAIQTGASLVPGGTYVLKAADYLGGLSGPKKIGINVDPAFTFGGYAVHKDHIGEYMETLQIDPFYAPGGTPSGAGDLGRVNPGQRFGGTPEATGRVIASHAGNPGNEIPIALILAVAAFFVLA